MGRFSARQSTIIKDLTRVMTNINATSMKIEQDLLGGTAGAKITFDRGGKRYVSACDTYDNEKDNLRAAQLAIEYTYRIADVYDVDFGESGQVDLIDRLFLPFEATPDPNIMMLPSGSWHDVLGVDKDASEAAIRNAYRALARDHHPDAGGDAETFKRIRAAYEEGIEHVKSN